MDDLGPASGSRGADSEYDEHLQDVKEAAYSLIAAWNVLKSEHGPIISKDHRFWPITASTNRLKDWLSSWKE